jgi:stearoyl-CoA desaturase (delta-9 desaturase)
MAHAGLLKHRWLINIPFWGIHIAAVVGAILVGWSWGAFAWLAASYAVRMFAITAGYHRYFAHRTFKTGRAFQLVLAVTAMSTAQRGVLWWASQHRTHHRFSDQPGDVHSPRLGGFWWSHVGWLLAGRHAETHWDRIKDFAKYPELRWLNRHDVLIAVAWGFVLYLLGGTTALVWGHFVPLVLVWHVTFLVNSLAHVLGSQRYTTSDDSRNNAVIALLTFGEGWHNNHHHYQRSARQGFYWWEVDVTFYVLKLLEAMRIVSGVQGVPRHVRDETAHVIAERAAARAG